MTANTAAFEIIYKYGSQYIQHVWGCKGVISCRFPGYVGWRRTPADWLSLCACSCIWDLLAKVLHAKHTCAETKFVTNFSPTVAKGMQQTCCTSCQLGLILRVQGCWITSLAESVQFRMDSGGMGQAVIVDKAPTFRYPSRETKIVGSNSTSQSHHHL